MTGLQNPVLVKILHHLQTKNIIAGIYEKKILLILEPISYMYVPCQAPIKMQVLVKYAIYFTNLSKTEVLLMTCILSLTTFFIKKSFELFHKKLTSQANFQMFHISSQTLLYRANTSRLCKVV